MEDYGFITGNELGVDNLEDLLNDATYLSNDGTELSAEEKNVALNAISLTVDTIVGLSSYLTQNWNYLPMIGSDELADLSEKVEPIVFYQISVDEKLVGEVKYEITILNRANNEKDRMIRKDVFDKEIIQLYFNQNDDLDKEIFNISFRDRLQRYPGLSKKLQLSAQEISRSENLLDFFAQNYKDAIMGYINKLKAEGWEEEV